MAAAAAGCVESGYGHGDGGDGGDEDPSRFHSYKVESLHMVEAYRGEDEDDDTDNHGAPEAGIPTDAPVVPAEGNITGTARAQHNYRGVRSEPNGTYVSYLHCRNPPSTRGMKVWLGRFSSARSAAMAYDVFSVFNHHDSLVNFPQHLHMYMRFVPRRAIDGKGLLRPLRKDHIEEVKHIGAGIIRAFFPVTYINLGRPHGDRRSSSSSRKEKKRRDAKHNAELEQRTRDAVHSLLENQQAAALQPENSMRSMPSSVLHNLDLSSIQIPHPPHPSTAYNAQLHAASTPPVRQQPALSHDPTLNPENSPSRYGHAPRRFRRTRSSKEDTNHRALSSHRKEFASKSSHRRFSYPGALRRFDDEYAVPRAELGPWRKSCKALNDSSDWASGSKSRRKHSHRAARAVADDLLGQYTREQACRHCGHDLAEGHDEAQIGVSHQSGQLLSPHSEPSFTSKQRPLPQNGGDAGAEDLISWYDGEQRGYRHHGLENAPVEGQVHAQTGPSERLRQLLAAHAESNYPNVQKGLEYGAQLEAQYSGSMLYNLMGNLALASHGVVSNKQNTQGNNVNITQRTRQNVPSALGAAAAGSPSLPSMRMHASDIALDAATRQPAKYRGSEEDSMNIMVGGEIQGLRTQSVDDGRELLGLNISGGNNVDMVIREPFVRRPTHIPDLNLTPPRVPDLNLPPSA